MRIKNTIRMLSYILVAIFICQGVTGCVSTQTGPANKKVIYKAIVPQGVTATLKEQKESDLYNYTLKFEDKVLGGIYFHTRDSYAYEYVLYYRKSVSDSGVKELKIEPLGDTGKRVLYLNYGGAQWKAKIRGTLHRGEENIIIDKNYVLAKGQTSIDETIDIPTYVTMYCRQGENYYIIKLSGFSEVKSDEWLLSFGLDLSGNKAK